MARLWVVAINLEACFAGIFRDDESAMPLDDLLDLRVLVTCDQHKNRYRSRATRSYSDGRISTVSTQDARAHSQ